MKKYKRIFENYKKWCDNLESSLRGSMNPTQNRKPRRPMNISIPQSVKSTLVTYSIPEDFILPRATPLQG
jgi:hypothetical protein